MNDHTELIRQLKTYEDGYGLYDAAAAAIEALQATIELMKPFMPDFFPGANNVKIPKIDPPQEDEESSHKKQAISYGCSNPESEGFMHRMFDKLFEPPQEVQDA